MLTIEDIKKTIVSLLQSQNLKVYGTEIKLGFKRPCLFVQIMPIKSDMATRSYSEHAVTVEIVYFSQNETDLENIKMYDKLSSIFLSPLKINDRRILPKNIRMEENESNDIMTYDSMSFKFDINYYDEILNSQPVAISAGTVNLNSKGGI